MNESALQRRLLSDLNQRRYCCAVKLHPYIVGDPDIVGCYYGHIFLLECKVRYNRSSKIQQHRQAVWRNALAEVEEAREDFDVDEFLKELLK